MRTKIKAHIAIVKCLNGHKIYEVESGGSFYAAFDKHNSLTCFMKYNQMGQPVGEYRFTAKKNYFYEENYKKSFNWKLLEDSYPKKRSGFNLGVKILAREVETQQQFDSILQACKNYSKELSYQGTDGKFAMNFAEFARGGWEDYVDIDFSELENKPCKKRIKAALSSGARKIADVQTELSDSDKDFIRNHGGMISLNQMGDFAIDRLFG